MNLFEIVKWKILAYEHDGNEGMGEDDLYLNS
jgi:hypothetical protein